MYAERYAVTIVTDAAGAGTGYTPVLTGRILAILYTKASVNPYAAGVDVTITLESTGESVWTEADVNASKTVRPVAAGTLPTGVASTLSEGPIVAVQDRVKIAIAQGGNTLTGTFTVVVG